TVHGCCVSADVFDYTVTESFQRNFCQMASFVSCFLHVTEITGDAAAHTENTGCLIHNVQHLVDVDVLRVGAVLQNCRIQSTASGSHDQTFQRWQSRTGIHTFACDGSIDAGAIDEVTYDLCRILRIESAEFDCLAGYEQMARSVEPVSADS